MTFKVRLQPSGQEFQAAPRETVLDAALRQGVMLPYGCRNGACGSCKGKLLEGRLDYDGFEVTALSPALSKAELQAGYALFCQARPLTDLTIEARTLDAAGGIKPRILPCRVSKLERLTADVMRVFLKLPAAERLQFLAGQYIDFLLPTGRRRSFSIANAPQSDEFIELHIKHIEGGRFTGDVFSELKEKALLRLEGPLGNFYLRKDSTRPIIFVAGGTGFGPIKGIIESALAEGITRPMHLYWGARAQRDLYLDQLPRAWQARHGHFHYTPVLSQPQDHWSGKTGYAPPAVMEDFPGLSGYEVYTSGPPAMVRDAQASFLKRGLTLENFYSDAFEFNENPVLLPRSAP